MGSKTDYEAKMGSSCNFIGHWIFHYYNIIEKFVKTFSAKFLVVEDRKVQVLVKISCYFPEPNFRKILN
jgi:hypothetical protein